MFLPSPSLTISKQFMKDDLLYLERILGAIKKIQEYTKNQTQQAFFLDEMRQSAIMMQLILIGEMAKKVSVETRAVIDIPWKQITGFRDRGIHDYFDMDLGIVWVTATEDIFIVEKAIREFWEKR